MNTICCVEAIISSARLALRNKTSSESLVVASFALLTNDCKAEIALAQSYCSIKLWTLGETFTTALGVFAEFRVGDLRCWACAVPTIAKNPRIRKELRKRISQDISEPNKDLCRAHDQRKCSRRVQDRLVRHQVTPLGAW